MKQVLTFTDKLAKNGRFPTGLRSGTQLEFFKYSPDNENPFSGVTAEGHAYTWNKYGHLNGSKRNMKTDLVFDPTGPDEVLVTIARVSSGGVYAINTGNAPLKSDYTPYTFLLNTKTGEVRAGKKLQLVKHENTK